MKFEEFSWTRSFISPCSNALTPARASSSVHRHSAPVKSEGKRVCPRSRLDRDAAVRPPLRRREKGRSAGRGWMRRRAGRPSKYITDVPATAKGVPAHLLSPQSSSDDLCIGYQSQKLLNWVETVGAGEEGGGGRRSPRLPLAFETRVAAEATAVVVHP